MKTFLFYSALFLLACSDGDSAGISRDTSHACPKWMVSTKDGGCRSPGPPGPDEQTPGCAPVACQSYADWGQFGDGGAATGYCAAACQAACLGDPIEEAQNLADARDHGLTCRY